MPAQDTYIVGFGYYAECVGAYDTFPEALKHYAKCKPRRGCNEVRRLVNAELSEGEDPSGLTDEQRAAVEAVELGDTVERVLARYDLRCFAADLSSMVWG